MSNKAYVIAITGPSGSGKSSLIRAVRSQFSEEDVKYLQTDHYYLEHNDLSIDQRAELNYDAPSALDIPLLVEHIKQLKLGQAIDLPQYDFATHARLNKVVNLSPSPVILLDGILLLAVKELRPLIDQAIFLDTPLDLCLLRRLERDCVERQRTLTSVVTQYTHTVRPMLFEHILPSKQWADCVFAMGGLDQEAIDQLVALIQQQLDNIHVI